jgi:hypothetical protein
MNEWAKRTLSLVEHEDYLDRLQEIYPHHDKERDVSQTVIDKIKTSFAAERDDFELLSNLLRLKKFPYDDSYIAFLRKDKDALRRNPKTVERICNNLYKMGVDKVIEGLMQPKKANQQRGNSFQVWTRKKFSLLEADEFSLSHNGIFLLDGTDDVLQNFCNNVLRAGYTKKPDMVAKVNEKYIIGEAKFASSTGGNQGTGFEDGITIASDIHGRAHKIFLLDGVYWVHKGTKQYKAIDHSAANIFSALLLQDFLNSLL